MTKKEMIRKLDSMMMVVLDGAIRCADTKNEYCVRDELQNASGIMLSASALGLLSKEEFENINYCLTHTSMRWCR